MQGLKDEVVRGVFCASFVVRSSIGKFFADKKGCQDSEMSGASRIKRKWQDDDVESKNFQGQKTSKRSRSQRPCQPGGQALFL